MAAKIFDLAGKKVYVAGHRGMVGAALVRRLASTSCEIVTAPRSEVDLERQEQIERFLAATKPDVVIVAAAKVGGIHANNAFPAEFISDNLAIARNTIHGSSRTSRCARRTCSPGPSSRPTNGIRSPRSPASSCARPTAANTAPISSR
jgi:GDP-L-fucose synthase